MIPLSELDMKTDVEKGQFLLFDAKKSDWEQEQIFGMGQECEGMCGV
jgi:hypothetical protein